MTNFHVKHLVRLSHTYTRDRELSFHREPFIIVE